MENINIKYITAAPNMVDAIYSVLHTTIKTIYSKYYPEQVVDFFVNTIVKNIF